MSARHFVLDASVVIEWLLVTPTGVKVAWRIGEGTLHAPELVDAEVLHVLRKLVAKREVSADRALGALHRLRAAPLQRYSHAPMLERAWALRANFSGYDAFYIALAEALGAPLLTADMRASRAGGHMAKIEGIARD